MRSRTERQAARRYMHMTPWRSCRIGLCLRCSWRDLAGKNRRDKAAFIERMRGRL